MTTRPRTWCLITGVSPGTLGEALAASFLKRGINVIATAHQTNDISCLHPEPGSDHGFLVTLKMDVTRRRSIAQTVQQVTRLTDARLDFLVNAENYACLGPLLDADIKQAQGQYDVSVWGVLRVVQGCFALLREARGIVVNLGEEDLGMPYIGICESSKAAVRSLTRAMRAELKPFGVEAVCLNMPGICLGGAEGRVKEGSVDWPAKDEVEAAVERSLAGEKRRDRFAVAERVVQELLEEQPLAKERDRWQVMLIALLAWILPTWVLEGLVARAAGLNKLEETLASTAKDETKKMA